MSDKKKTRRRKAGWIDGDYGDFLRLSDGDREIVEMKYQLVRALRSERERQHLTQAEVAKLVGSGQARIAKIEGGDPSVSLDLLLKTLLALGKTRKQIARLLAA